MNNRYPLPNDRGSYFFTVMFAVLAIAAIAQLSDSLRTTVKAYSPAKLHVNLEALAE